jgi:hypothetical protein
VDTKLFCKTLKSLKARARAKNYSIKKGEISEIDYGAKEITLEKSLHYSILTFELAHECGHFSAIRGGALINWNYFFEKSYGKNKFKKRALAHVEKVYYEVDAWVRGAKFIPEALLGSYAIHARHCLTTYLEGRVDYKSEIKILQALQRAPIQLRKSLEAAINTN